MAISDINKVTPQAKQDETQMFSKTIRYLLRLPPLLRYGCFPEPKQWILDPHNQQQVSICHHVSFGHRKQASRSIFTTSKPL